METAINIFGFLADYFDVITLIICAGVGYILKNMIPQLDNRFIPAISGCLGILINIAGHAWAVSPEIIATGLVSGLAATGLHQAIKNLIDKFGASVDTTAGGGTESK